jgi:glucosamine-6-phosphate deaminase
MNICISDTRDAASLQAASFGIYRIQQAIREQGHAAIILATGLSQLQMMRYLVKADIDWSVVEVFHLDEYVGISVAHRASFRKYLKDNFELQVKGLKAFHYIPGDSQELDSDIKVLNKLISRRIIDVAFVGIGENGHLAFNDPPADFDTETPYLIVTLDTQCKQQQVNEGWFESIATTPPQAVSMSIRQIMKSRCIVNTVPDLRKAKAVAACLSNEVSELFPASILQKHGDCSTFLDRDSASLLSFKRG